MKKRLATTGADPNGLLPFGPQVTSSVNDLNLQLSNCPLPQKPPWDGDPRQPFTAPVSLLNANMPTSSKSEYAPTTGDENRNSVGLTPPVINQSQYDSPKKCDITGQASFNTSQLIEAFIHSAQIARGVHPQQSDLSQLILEMAKNQLHQQQPQQSMNRTILQRATPDKLLITSRSPPLRSPSESIRGFVDGNHSKPRTSFGHSPALQSPPPPLLPPPLSNSASRNQSGRPLTASDYNSASSTFYSHQFRQPTLTEQQAKKQAASLSIDQQLYPATLFYMMAQQQQQQQMRGHPPPQMPLSSHSEGDKKSLIDYSKVGLPSNARNPKNDPYSSHTHPQSHNPYIRVPPSYHPWSKTEPSSFTGSGYSTIDILRESKQASESAKPANKLLTTSGVFYPEKQPIAPPPPPSAPPASSIPSPAAAPAPAPASSIKNQSDAVDHHFQMALSNNRSGSGGVGGSTQPEPPTPVEMTNERKASDSHKYPHPFPNHSSVIQTVHHGVSSCSSSSSISSMSLFDRDANSPSRKLFPLPPPKSENRINSEACRFSLKKRLIQRYQADATTGLASESAAVNQERIPEQQPQTMIKQEPGAILATTLEASSSDRQFFAESSKAEEDRALPGGHESPSSPASAHSIVNGSLPEEAPSKDITKCVANSTARRHPPVRASKMAPLMCSLNESSQSPSTTSSLSKRVRNNAVKQHPGFTSVRKRTAAGGSGESSGTKLSRVKPTKPRFYNSRVASPAAASDTALQSSRRSRTTSVRSTTDQTHSEFDFNGQDEDEKEILSIETSGGSAKATPNRRWFGSRKRKSTAASSGPLLRIKVPRRSIEEEEAAKRPKHRKRTQNTRQNKTTLNTLPRNYLEEEDYEEEEEEEREESNEDDLETTTPVQREEERGSNGGEDEKGGRGEESLKCHRCGQLVKAVKIGRLTDPFDFQCCEEKLSLQKIRRRLPPPPNLAILSHRSLCGGELGAQDVDDAGSEAESPFLQLNSCTELERLKPSFRCRACREASRVSSTTIVETNSKPSVIGNGNNNSTTDKNGARRRNINNRNHPSSAATSANNPSSSRGTSDAGNDSKTAAATVSVFCRFWGFRKLYYDQKGLLSVSDFCRTSEADSIDRSLWAMHHHVSPPLSRQNAMYCLEQLGAIACRLMLSELSILSSSTSGYGTVTRQCRPSLDSAAKNLNSPSRHVAWKRPVQGVREMCDVCETTMFNSHWVCTKCGYSVCSACYYAKAASLAKTKDSPDPLGDVTSSVTSTVHESVVEEVGVKNLSPAVVQLSFEDYSVRQPWSTCSASRRPHDPSKMMLTALLPFGSLHCLWHRLHRIVPRLDCPCTCPSAGARTTIEDVASPASSTDTSAATSLDLLADLALKSTTSSGGSLEDSGGAEEETVDGESRELSQKAGSLGVLYLKDGDPTNFKAFQQHWATNQPVVISGCGRHFNASLWTAKSLSRENSSPGAASQIVLIDCETNLIVPRHPIRAFWEAFDAHLNNSKRASSTKETTRPLQHLKIREWPPLGDLAEAHPDRYADFTEHLPLPEYTHREGQLNLAARLPSFFVRPDLGPRLHIAQDLTSQPKIGTMNLRVDVTDVINVLMTATRQMEQMSPKGGEGQLRAFLRTASVDVAEVFLTKEHTNVSSARGLPGAVWHIFKPCDTPVLREYLTKVHKLSSGPAHRGGSGGGGDAGSAKNSSAAGAHGNTVGDVIHDQRIYLSEEQLEDLKVETGIKPYTVLQFPGDAVFIPSGSVHQVRNLANCINVSSDFISPEHILQCLELTEEFRRLPRNHPSHEDKLQVKNMIYHAVKDALSTVLKTTTTTSASNHRHPSSPTVTSTPSAHQRCM
ncbi:Lysine-specific demethylase 3A-A [Echinococcus granulosus]|uniref:Jumonji domain containing 1A n=1 Tax=Echinococcus granulosus TaxID=6210 RepID=A0A068WJ07_ECHGR|nr:Lysine-specific demethylase 3A-A [Echinococcus granulosus]CDS20075.1 jumonji domain containing 1A [Echinococcus granulosus]